MTRTAAFRRSLVAVLSSVAIVAVAALLLRWHPEQVRPLEGIEAPRAAAADGFEGGEPSRVAQAPRRDVQVAESTVGSNLATAPDASRAPALRLELLDELGNRFQSAGAFAFAYDERGEELRPQEEVPSVLVWHELAPGRWWIHAGAPGFAEEILEIEVTQSAEPIERKLALARITAIRIVLLDESGLPHDPTPEDGPFLDLYPTRERPPHTLEEGLEPARRFECGTLRGAGLAGLEPHVAWLLELECEPPLFVSLVHELHVLETKHLEPGMDELVFVVDPAMIEAALATLRLKVVDAATRLPIRDLRLRLSMGADSVRLYENPEPVPEIVLRRLDPGPALLELRPLGHEPLRRELVLAPGAALDLGPIELRAIGPSNLRVNVRGPSELERATIAWARPELFRADLRTRSWETETVAVEEELELHPGNGDWVVWAEAHTEAGEWRSALHPVQLAGSDEDLTLELMRLAPLVFEPLGERRTVRVLDEHGLVVDMQELEIGLFPLSIELVPASYRIWTRDPRGRIDELDLELRPRGASLRLP